jgi:hypothetical protein
MLTVIDRFQCFHPQQVREFPRINGISLVAVLHQPAFSRIAYDQFIRPSPQHVIQPLRMCSFFEGHMQSSIESGQALPYRVGFRWQRALHDHFPKAVSDIHH